MLFLRLKGSKLRNVVIYLLDVIVKLYLIEQLLRIEHFPTLSLAKMEVFKVD